MSQSPTLNNSLDSSHRSHPRTSLRVRNVSEGVVYHLVFEGNLQRLSGRQLRHHLAQICHVPPSEQHLFVHGAAFPAMALGASVGLRQDDTVELVRASDHRGSSGGGAGRSPSLPNAHRGQSAVAASSLRPSTDAQTMSPASPYDDTYGGVRGFAQPLPPNSSPAFPSRQPTLGGGGAAAVGHTATPNSLIAPSPNRLIEGSWSPHRAQRQQQPYQHGDVRTSRQPRSAETRRSLPTAEGASLQFQQQQQHQQEQQGTESTQDDSQLPLRTSATNLSLLPGGYQTEEGGSPHPHMPSKGAGSGPARPPDPPPPIAERSRVDASEYYDSSGYYRPSYEVPSPYEPQRRRPRPSQQHPQRAYDLQAERMPVHPSSDHPAQRQQQDGTRNGLNQSRMGPVLSGSASVGRTHRSPLLSSSLPLQAPPPFPCAAEALQHHSAHPAATAGAPSARYASIRADDLATLLDEQDYIWRMEEYRFRTERVNRFTALQNRQRELAFEAARCDEAVAEVAGQLQRERRKLMELQEAMSRRATSLGRFNKRIGGGGLSRRAEDNAGDGDGVEVVDADA
ncbi:hypothetical protein ABL78_1006 [Leptomonas seymouri]|uniref:Ubiquitin-like domain-containing protein n=1 Tax=Leptomonas seymouri TaxID=5684 RepID=A0A0N1I832_LEPSE|nr:hypothetical protein ABL78_1006 [Leptomonas seymouri]|eukprot:KPI89934.1 hypothetical protein ABL78_1006 [Leptomonas seymouri]